MTFWHRPGLRVLTKGIAVFVALSFVMPFISWAFDVGNYTMPQAGLINVHHLGKILTLPGKLGMINQGFQGNGKMVVHIQDLHCNYEVQMNIARIIHVLAEEHGLGLVGKEGAFHTVNTTKISTFPVKKVRKEVSDYFVKQGKLTGAEYYAANGEYPIRLEGIETPALYAANKKAVRSFLNYESLGYCYDLREILDEMKSGIYSPQLRKFDAKRRAWRAGEMDMLKYCAHLFRTSQKSNLDFSVYPNLERFLSLRQNFFSQKIDPDKLFREIDILDAVIRQMLYTSDAQAGLDAHYRRVDIIEKLLNISVSPEELQEFRNQREKYTAQAFWTFINQHSQTKDGFSESGTWNPEFGTLDKYLQSVENFYRIADERSAHFVDNLARKMDRFEHKLAVMITGGFHTSEVLAELKRRDISYVSIKPRLTRQDIVNPYFALLQNRQTPLEKLLAKNQDILALRTRCGDAMLESDKVIPTARLERQEQRSFSKFAELLSEITAIVNLIRQGVEIRAIPEEMRKILKDFPANEHIGVALAKLVEANKTVRARINSSSHPVVIIPTTVKTEQAEPVKTIAILEPKTSPAQRINHELEQVSINDTNYLFYSSKNIPQALEEILESRQPVVVWLPKDMKPEDLFALFGFHGRLVRLAWIAARQWGRIHSFLDRVIDNPERMSGEIVKEKREMGYLFYKFAHGISAMMGVPFLITFTLALIFNNLYNDFLFVPFVVIIDLVLIFVLSVAIGRVETNINKQKKHISLGKLEEKGFFYKRKHMFVSGVIVGDMIVMLIIISLLLSNLILASIISIILVYSLFLFTSGSHDNYTRATVGYNLITAFLGAAALAKGLDSVFDMQEVKRNPFKIFENILGLGGLVSGPLFFGLELVVDYLIGSPELAKEKLKILKEVYKHHNQVSFWKGILLYLSEYAVARLTSPHAARLIERAAPLCQYR